MRAVVACDASLATREEQPAVGCELEDLLERDVGHPHVVLVINREAVGHDEEVSSPFAEALSRAAVEDPNG